MINRRRVSPCWQARVTHFNMLLMKMREHKMTREHTPRNLWNSSCTIDSYICEIVLLETSERDRIVSFFFPEVQELLVWHSTRSLSFFFEEKVLECGNYRPERMSLFDWPPAQWEVISDTSGHLVWPRIYTFRRESAWDCEWDNPSCRANTVGC